MKICRDCGKINDSKEPEIRFCKACRKRYGKLVYWSRLRTGKEDKLQAERDSWLYDDLPIIKNNFMDSY